MNEPVNRRYISSAGPGRDGQDDPLAELARIVGKNDPFADLFNEARGAPALRAPTAAPQPTPHDDNHFDTPQLRGSMGHLDDDGWFDEPSSSGLRRPMAGPYVEEAGEAEDFDEATRYADYPEEAYAPADAYEGGRHPRTAPRRGFGLMGVTLLALVVAGGAGAYALRHGSIVSGSFANLSGTLPVIKASTDPVKIKPPAPADANTSQPTKEILDRIGQNGSNETEKIVSREELPVATVPKKVQAIRIETIPATADPAPQTTGTAVTPIVPLPTRDIAAAKPTATVAPLPTRDIAAPAPVKPLVTRDIGAATPAAPLPSRDIAAAPPAAGQADAPQLPAIMPSTPEPRKVRTIKVLADNSFVTGEAPAVPTRSIGDLAPPQQGLSIAPPPIVEPPKPAAVSPAPVVPPAPAKVAAADPVAAIPELAPLTPAQPVLTMRGIDPPAAAPQADAVPSPATDQEPIVVAEPPVRPKNIPVTHPKPVASPVATDDAAAPKPAPVKVASADPEPVAAPAAVSGGAFVVQVSSQKTQADAMTAWQAVQRKFGAVVGGMKPSIKKAEVGDRGTFYRVRVGPWGTSAEAAAFCSKLKAAGGDCVITRN